MKVVVTGAFGYSGREIASRLLIAGHEVVTLTNTVPERDPFNGAVSAYPLNFCELSQLESVMSGCDVFVNTYWVRFNHRKFTHRQAVENTSLLFQTAKSAGIKRIIHTSIANADEGSPFEYYRCKAEMERELRETGIPYTILRPTVIFGPNDILINNIAWTLRRFPVVGYFGNGQYRIRPIHVADFADLVCESVSAADSSIINAVGPEDFTYRDLLKNTARIMGVRRLVVPVPVWCGYAVASAVGWWHKDVFLTRSEVGGLMANLLTTEGPATGHIHLTEWLRDNLALVGRRYASELARRRGR
ncbi:MAG: NAD(P)H-binding protein [Planctomycetia bacterium]|nr:NAD(P)H-binding protein [Planctomycetia bacterium]